MADTGVKYFPLDVHLEDNVRLIEAEFGLKGFAIIVKLYQKIYSVGYYCEWNDEVALLFAQECGVSKSAVSEILAASIRRDIFDGHLFDVYGILTSSGIQRRYLDIVKRRASVDLIEEYLLVPDTQKYQNVNILSKNVYRNPENVYINEQSKEKESKVNKSKVTDNIAAAVVKAYQDNIGFVSPAIFEKICAWLDDVDESLIIYAIEQAVFNNKSNWQYINAILNNHFKAGRKTRADAEKVPKGKPAEEKKSIYDHGELERRAFMKVAKYDYDEIREKTFLNVTKGIDKDA